MIVEYSFNGKNITQIYEPVIINSEFKYININLTSSDYRVIDLKDYIEIIKPIKENKKAYEKFKENFIKVLTTVFRETSIPVFESENEIKTLVSDFEKNKDKAFASLFFKIRDFFKNRVGLSSEHDYDLVTSYLILSYIYEALTYIPNPKIGYLFIAGDMGSGKSTLIDNLVLIGLRAKKLVNPTGARLSRTIDLHKGLICVDDLKPAMPKYVDSKEAFEQVFNVLRAGTDTAEEIRFYSRMEPTFLYIFGPKVIATNVDLPEDVKDRCIKICMQRMGISPKSYEQNYIQRIINELYAFRLYFFLKELNNFVKKYNKLREQLASYFDARLLDNLLPLLMLMPYKETQFEILINEQKEKIRELITSESYDVLNLIVFFFEDLKMDDYVDLDFDNMRFVKNGHEVEEVKIDFNGLVYYYSKYYYNVSDESIKKLIKEDLRKRLRRILENNLGFKIKRTTRYHSPTFREHIYVVEIPSKLFFDKYKQLEETEKSISEDREKLLSNLKQQIDSFYIFSHVSTVSTYY